MHLELPVNSAWVILYYQGRKDPQSLQALDIKEYLPCPKYKSGAIQIFLPMTLPELTNFIQILQREEEIYAGKARVKASH
jgi:hypothetical protein